RPSSGSFPVGRASARPHGRAEARPTCDTSAAVTARIIDAKTVAQQIEQEVIAGISRLGLKPGLVAVRVGNDPASEIYVRNKAKKARELGLEGNELVFAETMSEAELL